MHCSRVLICLLKGNMVCIQFKHMYVSEKHSLTAKEWTKQLSLGTNHSHPNNL